MTTAFVCVLLAWLLIYLPRLVVIVAIRQGSERFDNNHPRLQQARLTGWGQRAQAAHQNSVEAFAPFAAAVIIAHLAGADRNHMTLLAIAFVVLRTLYCVVYVADQATLRSAVWAVALAANLGLFLLPWL